MEQLHHRTDIRILLMIPLSQAIFVGISIQCVVSKREWQLTVHERILEEDLVWMIKEGS